MDRASNPDVIRPLFPEMAIWLPDDDPPTERDPEPASDDHVVTIDIREHPRGGGHAAPCARVLAFCLDLGRRLLAERRSIAEVLR